jgi:hypothetical protein
MVSNYIGQVDNTTYALADSSCDVCCGELVYINSTCNGSAQQIVIQGSFNSWILDLLTNALCNQCSIKIWCMCGVCAVCRCRRKAVAGVATVVLVAVVCAALMLLVRINMVRDSEAPVHSGDFLKVLIRYCTQYH